MSIDLSNVPEVERLDTDELLALLGDVAADLGETLARSEALYELRTRVFVAARNRTPRVTLGQLAEKSGASEAAVTQVLHKVRRTASA